MTSTHGVSGRHDTGEYQHGLYKFKSIKDHRGPYVGSTQVPFPMCTLEIPQKLQYKFLLLTFCHLYF